MPEWYPVMLNLEGRECVVAGGGTVAERKTEGLVAAGAIVRVVSLSFTPRLKEWAEAGRIRLFEREAEDADLEGAALLFAATDSPEANRRIAGLARARGIPANLADDGELGDFISPAHARRGKLVFAATASGAGPALAARLVRDIEARFGDRYGKYAEALGEIRAIVKANVPDAAERRLLLRAAAETDEALEEWANADWLQDIDKLLKRLRQRAYDGKG